MTTHRNPQAAQMGDESMARNLALQAQAIWPLERPLFDRYGLDGAIDLLDLGCGTGEITLRLAQRYPAARLVGVDILPGNIARAGALASASPDAARIRFVTGDAFALEFADASFDLVVCRHVSQAVPEFERVLEEIARVLRPGGVLHLLAEDYGMIHLPQHPRDLDRFWLDGALAYLGSIGCDGRSGRHMPGLLEGAGYEDIELAYLPVDTLRVRRTLLAGILEAWRDGYVGPLAQATGRAAAELRADFDAMIELVATPPHYMVWHVPIASARRAHA